MGQVNHKLLKFIMAAIIVAAAGMLTGTTGCANPQTQHPGAINAFDSQAYDALITLQAGINEAKKQFGSNPAAKDPLNKVIAAYDAAQAAYKAYHTAAAPDAAAQAQLQGQIDSLKVSLAAVVKQFGASK